MAKKKYIVRNFSPGKSKHNKVNDLISLSQLGIDTDRNIIKSSMALGVSETDTGTMEQYMPYSSDLFGTKFNKYKDITKSQSSSYAFFDLSYVERRDYLRTFACDQEINFILDTITNESIVYDEHGYFASLDLDKLKLSINKSYKDKQAQSDADKLITDCKRAYNKVYSCFGWDLNSDAWSYYKKFLIDGFLAFEIIFDNPENPKTIVAFKELDPSTLEPDIKIYNGQEVQVWYQYRGDASREHIIPDANLIYISWAGMNFAMSTRISYLEGLVRSFNMLRQLENAHCIWNIQNSQKRIKITVPVGTMTESKVQNRVSELIADYNEEVTIDDASGEVTINGYPKFSFSKTYVIPQRDGQSTAIEEIGGEGYDMNTTETLQYFWRKFILESQVPANRFTLNISNMPNNPLVGDSVITREEYAFARFIQRIQNIFKEILLKPLWIQICLMHPELAYSSYLRTCLGITFNEENMFTLAKKRQIVNDGTNTVSNLSSIQGLDQKPIFSVEWLIKEFMGLSDADLEMNRQYKKREIIADIEKQKLIKKHMEEQQPATQSNQAAGGDDSGGGFGGGFDTGDSGGGFGGGFDTGDSGGGFGDDTGGADLGGFGDDTGADAGGGFGDTEPAADDAGL